MHEHRELGDVVLVEAHDGVISSIAFEWDRLLVEFSHLSVFHKTSTPKRQAVWSHTGRLELRSPEKATVSGCLSEDDYICDDTILTGSKQKLQLGDLLISSQVLFLRLLTGAGVVIEVESALAKLHLGSASELVEYWEDED
jgi:hypothetical protein